ncbi:ABC transporter ATP-binding protein [Rhodopseudomonas palustris]|uniref:ABC transporter ATP-binding protein n=1 Tax=Rhodopseudomonas palustris TaxID=1076 RepID=A0A418V126_RHOPL|nr:ABC transporter ATP-binding protein [Rhodopseudomonas palustris]RJF69498.1 ABC transporter ATP-binding protein [Rhodopseudomonas palustris]
MLRVENLKVAYGSVEVVHALDLEIESGRCLALLGANGAGKTSSVEAIAGLLPASGGRVTFDGRDITRKPASTIVRGGLALVPQWRELFPNFSVDETLRAGMSAPRGRPPLPLDTIYEMFPALASRKSQLAGSLSGGEQQMLAIGRALITNPKVMLLDEPSAGLAVGITRSMIGIVQQIRERGIGILLVEQNLEIARALADDCIVLATGRVAWRGAMSDALASDAIADAYFS